MPPPARALVLLVAFSLLCAGWAICAPHAFAHFPPPAYLVMRVDDDAVTVRLVVNHDVCRDWLGIDPEAVEGNDGGEAAVDADLRRRVEAAFPALLKVRIDRIEVAPVFERLVKDTYFDHGVEWKYVNVSVRYPALGQPRQVAFAWLKYEAAGGYGFASVDAELDGPGKTLYPAFRPNEPEVVWHRPREVPPAPEAVLPKPEPPPRIELPAISLGVLGLLALVFFAARARGVPARERWGGVAVGMGLVLALTSVGLVPIELPGGGFERPPDEEALYTAETLLRNVYRAFDHDREDEIYDTLAQSVSGALLDRLYVEVHQSLVMKEQGGAVAKVENVEMLDNAVLPPEEEGAPWYRTHTRWRVQGKVGHWGHTHQRVNEYEADLTIALDEGAWKIAALDVQTQKRVDDGEEFR